MKLGAAWLMNLSGDYNVQAGGGSPGTQPSNTGNLMSMTGIIDGLIKSAVYTYDMQGRLVTSNQTSEGGERPEAVSTTIRANV